jgi:hypothetical protein
MGNLWRKLRRFFKRQPTVIYHLCPVCQQQADQRCDDTLGQDVMLGMAELQTRRRLLVRRDDGPMLDAALAHVEQAYVRSMAGLAGELSVHDERRQAP